MTIRWLSFVLVFALILVPAFADKADKQVSDGQIHDQVLVRLAGDPEVRGGNIDVEVAHGAVTLKGKVETEKQKTKAEKLAKKVKGVASVDNQLVVGPR
jgi:hyperosmotically inducible protein